MYWLGVVALAACHASPRSDQQSCADRALQVLDPARIEKDTRYLGSDELEGRAPGTPGGAKAEEIIAARYHELGLAPGGEGGTYFQTVPLRQATPTSASVVVATSHGTVTLDQTRDVFVRGNPRAAQVALEAPLAFVGYGLERPDLGYDDLAGVDLHGAIAVIFSGAPRTLHGQPVDPALHAALSEVAHSERALCVFGVVGYITVWDPARARDQPWSGIFEKAPRITFAWLDGGVAAADPVLPSVTIGVDTLDRIAGATVAQTAGEPLARGT